MALSADSVDELHTPCAFSMGLADARGLLDFVAPHHSQWKEEYRSGSLNADEVLSLYTAKQRLNSFEACADQFPGNRLLNLVVISNTAWSPENSGRPVYYHVTGSVRLCMASHHYARQIFVVCRNFPASL